MSWLKKLLGAEDREEKSRSTVTSTVRTQQAQQRTEQPIVPQAKGSERNSRIAEWEKVTGSAAVQFAEEGNVARPGTFSAVAIKWNGAGKAPSSVTTVGSIKCGYCGTSVRFELEGMSSQVPCGGCGSAYSLFSTDNTIDGKEGRIIVASVFSHAQGTGIVLPQIDISDVAVPKEPKHEDRKEPAPSLGMFDCLDKGKIKNFVDAGGNINARDDDQWTALHRAAFMDLAEGVRNLLEFGADPDLPVLPGASKRTAEVVRNNKKPNAGQIEAMLTRGNRQR
jgi:hypothetical protein